MENITENNKLIVEFMGWTDTGNKGLQWNWLIPVCESFFEKAITYLDGFDEINSLLHDSLWSLNIVEFHKAIIKAIKWYNQCNTK